jgi:mannan endo-1,4-beta-mannosidase
VTTISKCPVIIGETACAETGGSKGQWITDAFKKIISDFPRIEALVWFDIKKECDWRIGSSDESLKAFRASAGIFNVISE